MKYLSLFIIFIFACENSTSSKEEEPKLFEFNDQVITYEDGINRVVLIKLTDFVTSEKVDPALVSFEVMSNLENDLFRISVNGKSLILYLSRPHTGTEIIQIRAHYDTEEILANIQVNVKMNTIYEQYLSGVNDYQNGKYSEAETIFLECIKSTDELFFEDYIFYLGITEFKLQKFTEAYAHLATGVAYSKKIERNEYYAIMGILDYIPRRNYSNAITKIDNILDEVPLFSSSYLTSINHYDLKLIKSISQYELGQYDEAIQTLQRVDSTIELNSEDVNFHSQFSEIYNNLALMYL